MTGSPKILHAAEAHEFFTDEQCFITEYSNSANDPELSIARARVRPGITTQWHCLHGLTERYCILAGRGEAEIGSLPAQPVCPGDVVIIPAGVRQRIRNTGDADLVFLAICTPRFTPSAYQAL